MDFPDQRFCRGSPNTSRTLSPDFLAELLWAVPWGFPQYLHIDSYAMGNMATCICLSYHCFPLQLGECCSLCLPPCSIPTWQVPIHLTTLRPQIASPMPSLSWPVRETLLCIIPVNLNAFPCWMVTQLTCLTPIHFIRSRIQFSFTDLTKKYLLRTRNS